MHNAESFPSNFNMYRHDRCDGYGGILIAVHKSLTLHEVLYSGIHDIVACRLKLSNNVALLAVCVYRPPNCSIDQFTNLCSSLESVIPQYPNDAIWLAGDFNLDWNNNTISDNNYPLPMNESFLDFSNKFGLSQIVTLPTRGNNILDIFLTNRPSAITYCNIYPCISDHHSVIINSSVSIPPHQPCRRKIHLWNRANNIEILSFLLALI